MIYKQTYFSKISNTIFIISIMFILSFVWINFYLRNLRKSLLCSILITVCFCITLLPIKHLINKIKLKKINSLNNKDYFKTQLLLGNDNQSITTICKAYNLTNLSQTGERNHLVDNVNNIDYFFIFYNLTSIEKTIVELIKNHLYNKIIVFSIDNLSFPTISNLEIKNINHNELYEKLNSQNINLDYNIKINKKPKLSLKTILCTVLNHSRSKAYFSFGFLLIFSSLFTPFSTYYIIIGTFLLILALYSRYNKRFN